MEESTLIEQETSSINLIDEVAMYFRWTFSAG